MSNQELLPCPFCGKSDFLVERLDNSASVVICQGMVDEYCACLARGPVGLQDDDGEDQPGYAASVRGWNERAQQPASIEVVELLRFVYRHPVSGETHTVVTSRDEVAHHMDDVLFGALIEEHCKCEPIGETNVVECRCDEYCEEFELVKDAPLSVSGEHKPIHQWEYRNLWHDCTPERYAAARAEGYDVRIVYVAPPVAKEVAGLIRALEMAEQWLGGWASAGHQLSVIREALAAHRAQRGGDV